MNNHNRSFNFAIYKRGSTRIDFPLSSLFLKIQSTCVGTHCLQILFTLIIMVSTLSLEYKIMFVRFPDLLPWIQFWKLWSKNIIIAAFNIPQIHYVLNQRNFFEQVKFLYQSRKSDQELAEILNTFLQEFL